MATDELKPCPFCGGQPEPHWTFAANWVECHHCGTVMDCEGSIEETFARWNRRAPCCPKPTKSAQLVDSQGETVLPAAAHDSGVQVSAAPSITDEELTRRFTRCAYRGPNPMYRCNGCGAEEFGVRHLLVEHALACGVAASPEFVQDMPFDGELGAVPSGITSVALGLPGTSNDQGEK